MGKTCGLGMAELPAQTFTIQSDNSGAGAVDIDCIVHQPGKPAVGDGDISPAVGKVQTVVVYGQNPAATGPVWQKGYLVSGNVLAELEKRPQTAGAVKGQVFKENTLRILAKRTRMAPLPMTQDQQVSGLRYRGKVPLQPNQSRPCLNSRYLGKGISSTFTDMTGSTVKLDRSKISRVPAGAFKQQLPILNPVRVSEGINLHFHLRWGSSVDHALCGKGNAPIHRSVFDGNIPAPV